MSTSQDPTDHKSDARRALIVGCRYMGEFVLPRLREAGFDVSWTSRDAARREELASRGVDAVPLDLDTDGEVSFGDRAFDAVIYGVTAGRSGDKEVAFAQGPLRVASALPSETRFVLLSSTGVYHQRDGSEVDENSPALSEERSHLAIRRGEQGLLEATKRGEIDGVVVRLGGLYGPGRSPVEWLQRPTFRERLRASALGWMNWIHAEDAATAISQTIDSDLSGEIVLACDGKPVLRRDFYTFAAELA
ncbi:MAG: NAD-dependent epimerase/dehydratase family protein, partial [Planctomycetota bacterium]